MQRTIESPIGPLTLLATDRALRGVLFGEPAAEPSASEILDAAESQLDEYFAGERTAFDLPLELQGTPFQRRVWKLLQTIPYGQRVTYQELAARLGNPRLARAVGAANARNPFAVIVPCHRLVGSRGGLTGYAGGLEAKAFLLSLEKGRRLIEGGGTAPEGGLHKLPS